MRWNIESEDLFNFPRVAAYSAVCEHLAKGEVSVSLTLAGRKGHRQGCLCYLDGS
jgi:hypothetical protein